MQFSFYALLSLPLLVAASPIEARQSDLASQLVTQINGITTDLTTLNNTLNGFPPLDPVGIFEALKIQSETSKVSSDLVGAAQTAQKSTNFTSDESNSVASAILTLEPVIFSVLDNIVSHKPSFATAVLFIGDISKTVEQTLEQQRQLSSQFSSAVTAKLAEPFSSVAPLISGQIDSAFATAIQAYQTCSGIICLLPLPSLPFGL